jgi:hypothetical protein
MTRLQFGGLLVAALAVSAQTPVADPLVAARRFYNEGRFDEAIASATQARSTPASADAAAVVLARAHLERYRRQADPADLDAAREALRAVREDALEARDRIEFLVGLGVSLFVDDRGGLEDRYSAAAELFETALARAVEAPGLDRDRILDWWCSALDRQAQFGPPASQPAIYLRVLARIDAELARDDRSTVALYWRVVAARGARELERAWGAAVAAWLRARYFGDRGATLRADVDRFVTAVLLPERAQSLTPGGDPRPTLALLEAQWTDFKERWRPPDRP